MVMNWRSGGLPVTALIVVLLALNVFSVVHAGAAEPSRKVRVAIPSIVIDFAPLWIARDKNFFRDERLDAEITYIQGNIRGVQALMAGEVQFGLPVQRDRSERGRRAKTR